MDGGEGSAAGSTVRQGGSSRQAAPLTDPPTILFLVMWCPFLPPLSERLFFIVVFETISLCHSKLFISEYKITYINYASDRSDLLCLFITLWLFFEETQMASNFH